MQRQRQDSTLSTCCCDAPAHGGAPSLCAPRRRSQRLNSRIARVQSCGCIAFGFTLMLLYVQQWSAPAPGAVPRRVALHELVLSRVQGLRAESQEERMLVKVLQKARAEVGAEHVQAQRQLETAEARDLSPVFPSQLAEPAGYDDNRCALVLDVRTKGEWQAGHISCARFFPVVDAPPGWQTDLLSLASGDKTAPIVTYCHSGVRAASAVRLLRADGYTQVSNGGGYTMSMNVTGIMDRDALEKVCQSCRLATQPQARATNVASAGRTVLPQAASNVRLSRPMSSPGYFRSSLPAPASSGVIDQSNATEFEHAVMISSTRSPPHNESRLPAALHGATAAHSLNQQAPAVSYINRPLAQFVPSGGASSPPKGARHVNLDQMRETDAEVMLELGVMVWIAVSVFATMACVSTVRRYLKQRSKLSILKDLAELESLRGRGVISDEEFQMGQETLLQQLSPNRLAPVPTRLGVVLFDSSVNGEGEEGLLVMTIKPGSIAAASGIIHAGDRVLSINGSPVEAISCDEIADLANTRPSGPSRFVLARKDGSKDEVVLESFGSVDPALIARTDPPSDQRPLALSAEEALVKAADDMASEREREKDAAVSTGSVISTSLTAEKRVVDVRERLGILQRQSLVTGSEGMPMQEEVCYPAGAYQAQDREKPSPHQPGHSRLSEDAQSTPTGSKRAWYYDLFYLGSQPRTESYGATSASTAAPVRQKKLDDSCDALESNDWPHLPVLGKHNSDGASTSVRSWCNGCNGCFQGLRLKEDDRIVRVFASAKARATKDMQQPAVRAALMAMLVSTSIIVAGILAPVAIVKAVAVLISGVASSVMVGFFSNFMSSGCVRDASCDSVVLDEGSSDQDEMYLDWLLTITDGCGAGQTRRISHYDGRTKTAIVSRMWACDPDMTSSYVLYADPMKNPVSIFEHMSIPHHPLEAPSLTRRDLEESKRNFQGASAPVPEQSRISDYVDLIESHTGSSAAYLRRREERRTAFEQRARSRAKADDRHLTPPSGPPDSSSSSQAASRATTDSSALLPGDRRGGTTPAATATMADHRDTRSQAALPSYPQAQSFAGQSAAVYLEALEQLPVLPPSASSAPAPASQHHQDINREPLPSSAMDSELRESEGGVVGAVEEKTHIV